MPVIIKSKPKSFTILIVKKQKIIINFKEKMKTKIKIKIKRKMKKMMKILVILSLNLKSREESRLPICVLSA